MRLYDLSIILHPHITDVELPATLEGIRKELQAMGARELQEEQIGKQRLGYIIKGNRFGHVIYFRFEAEEQNVNIIKKKLNVQPEVIRSMMSIVRHGLAFKPVHKPFRRGGTRDNHAQSFSTSPVSTAESISPKENSAIETLSKPTAEVPQKVDLAEIDKRIDDLINKETF
ncbi:MAG: 30S ribosomal protein S6 [Candidatus Magasanikbacteria bacterium GW2011_GWA2_45_39]|uniref:Small ribosomal subunit protein bS6 n=1 Tax=Candidatus Magasanikbacteria bacterium GW2011_GWA2_45_39 TaxID=1619041 RepID=A0A0G1MHD3_9BACT|nr:MAG: 30S ribosomal protein S6 [Candidatus Magasanikbacteria bacterium GW2011_GWA2_45_39]